MLRNSFTLLFSFILFITLSAQKMGIAVNISNDGTDIGKSYHRQFIRELRALHNDDLVIYDWDKKNHQLRLSADAGTKEKPVKIAYFVEQVTPAFDISHTSLNVSADKEGYVTGAAVLVDFKGSYRIRAVEVKTGKVVMSTLVMNTTREDLSSSSDLYKRMRPELNTPHLPGVRIDIKKHLKSKTTKRSLGRQFLYRMVKEYHRALNDVYWSDAEDQLKSITLVTQKMDSLFHAKEEIFSLEIPNIEAKKIKKMNVILGEHSGVKKYDRLDIYSIVEIEDKKIPYYIARVFVDKVKDGKAYCSKSGLNFSLERMSNALRAGAAKHNLFAVKKGIVPHSKAYYPEEDKVNVSIGKSDCVSCTEELQHELVQSLVVNLVERSAEKEVAQLLDSYKDGRFVDYNLGDYQDKRLGANFLFSIKDDFLSVTEIKTGRLFASDELQSGLDSRGNTISQAWRKALLSATDKEVINLEISMQKKKKIQGINAYHPFGFSKKERFDVFILEKEKVGDKIVNRKEYVANVFVMWTPGTGQIGYCAVMKGKKELYQAIQAGKHLVFDSAIIR